MLLLAWVLSALAGDAATEIALAAHRARVDLAVLSLTHGAEHPDYQEMQVRVRALEEQQERLGKPDEAEVRDALRLDLARQEVELEVLLVRYRGDHPVTLRARERVEAIQAELDSL